MTSQQQLIPHIHHERQEQGSMLCAQHALNALLQGNYYDPSQLADIANELDSLEASELGLSARDIANRDRNSLNMDDTGFFSVSVLERALQVWGLTLANWRSEAMRARQRNSDKERAFVLNLDSHWFTIRSFGDSGNFWFNLNSFLLEPSWVGKNYLGTLLHAAETEGYSIFMVHASEGTISDSLQTSDADQIADLLPPPGPATSTSNSALGLKPQASTALISNGDKSAQATSSGFGDEDTDLQAALRMSLADSAPSSSWSPVNPTKDRLRRARSGSGADPLEDGDGQRGLLEETDADIDAIAPTRRRPRSGTYHTSGDLRSSAAGPSSSSGAQDQDEELRRAMEASLAESGTTSGQSSDRPLGRRRRRIQRGPQGSNGLTQDDAIEVDDSLDPDDELLSTSLTHCSPFLSPAIMAANRNNQDVVDIADDEDEDIPSNDDVLDPFSVPGAPEASLVIGPRADRHYDDEDAMLQAALAASLGDPDAAARFGKTDPTASSKEWAYGDYEMDKSPPPADVDKISRMREEARKKERAEAERQERRARGDLTPEPEAIPSTSKPANKEGDDSDDDEKEEAEEVSAEEMRARRLARFG